MLQRAPRHLVLATLLALLTACNFAYTETRSAQLANNLPQATDPVTVGMTHFAFDDLAGLNTDTLETNAFPWKVTMTALLMDQAAREGTPLSAAALAPMLQRYGWIVPTAIENWAGPQQPVFDRPLGLVSGTLRRSIPNFELEVANFGCGACHGGMSYDAAGLATGRVWLGAPNSSRSFDGFGQAVLAAFNAVRGRDAELLAAIPVVFPAVSQTELDTIRRYVLPRIPERVDDPNGVLRAFDSGGPGLTNAIAILKLNLHAKPTLLTADEHGYTSIPDLQGRALRSSLLYDGAYALHADRRFVPMTDATRSADDPDRLAAIAAFFAVPTMGVDQSLVERQAPRVRQMLDFVYQYRPQPFPGPVDGAKAERGAALFATSCAACHGSYARDGRSMRLVEFPNRLVPQAEIGTDPERLRVNSDALIAFVTTRPIGASLNAANPKGYVASILSGLWASAPYLHNGSVPTLWDLMHPGSRPARFPVGGHRLDFAKVGIALEADAAGAMRYPTGYQPWALPVAYDTATAGRSNAGHDREFVALDEAQKDALLEYLKTL